MDTVENIAAILTGGKGNRSGFQPGNVILFDLHPTSALPNS